MTVIYNTLTDSRGYPAVGSVQVRLVGPSLRPITETEVIVPAAVTTDADGGWRMDLPANTVDAPFYIVTESAAQEQILQRVIAVPESASPMWMGDVVVVLPLAVSEYGSIYQGPPGPPGPPGESGEGSGGSGGPLGVVYGTSVDASTLPDGTLVVILSSDPA